MDIDLWAVILWIILFVLTICYFRLLLTICWFRSNRKSQRHTFVLLFSAPAILVFMAVYGSARSGDVWAFGWALADMVELGGRTDSDRCTGNSTRRRRSKNR